MSPDPAPCPRIALSDDYTVSRLIVGAWQWSAGHTANGLRDEDLFPSLNRLVDAGFTTFDCADIYTGVEERLGAYRKRLTREGRMPADGIQIHTKFVPDRDALAGINRQYVRRIVERSLTRLDVDRLDLVQFAWWSYDIPGWLETAGWLRELCDEGTIRHLGATNFDTARMREFADAGIPFLTNQVQYSMLDPRPERHLTAWCDESGLRLVAYGTLAGGFLSDRYRGAPPPVAPYENRSLTKYALVIDEFGGWERLQGLLDVLGDISAAHGSTIGAVAIRYVLDRDPVAAAIVGVRNDRHLEANLSLGRLRLTPSDTERIRAYCAGRGPAGDVFDLERDETGPHGRIMRYNLNAEA